MHSYMAPTMKDMQGALLERDLDTVRELLQSILADLPTEVFKKQSEGLYHGLVHIIFSYLGVFIQSEVHSSKGRADAVVSTPTDIFIFEFKFNRSAQEALDQIQKKKYADKYRAAKLPITAIGVNFDSHTRALSGWEVMDL